MLYVIGRGPCCRGIENQMFAATDVANFLACHHLSTLDRAQAAGQLEKPYFHDPGIELLRELGARHEQAYFRHLADIQRRDIVEIPSNITSAEAVAHTLDALRRGVSVIYQASFQHGPWHGRSDFLVRVQKPSALGAWSYEVVETKLARSTKAGALIQLCFYSDLISQIQKVQPDLMHVVLGGGTSPEKYPVDQYIAYFRRIKGDFDAAYSSPASTYPEPTEHCYVCSWYSVCDKRRHSDDHLSLVAGITRNQRKALVSHDVATVAGLGQLDLATKPKIDGIGGAALLRIREQARLQVEGREQGLPVYELLATTEADTGLSALPAASPGDVFLDFEGSAYLFEQGLEYLIGILIPPNETQPEPCYEAVWSFDRGAEKEAFGRFIANVMVRWRKYPDMHIYHYASYEPTAVKRLAGEHGICVDEVDWLLRAGIFVDLFRVVRQGVRASVESYSIKKLESLYGFTRAVPPRDSVLALQTFEAALALGNAQEATGELRTAIESYNKDDCLSAWQLRQWLEGRREELEARTGRALPRPPLQKGEAEEKLAAHIEQVRTLMARLVADLPTEETEWTVEHRATWLLAQMLEYHRREDKSAWWEYFRLAELSDDELLEDKNALGGLIYVGPAGQVKKSVIHRYRFPAQDHTIDRAHAIHDPKTRKSAGTVVKIDDSNGTVDIKRAVSSPVPHPAALIPQDIVDAEPMRNSLLRLGSWVADHGINGSGPFRAARDLLLQQAPRASLDNIEVLIDEHQQVTDAARQLVLSLSSQVSVLPIQGPPGSGKTYTGARMVVELVKNRRRVGITAVSHKVISRLLQEICEAARQADVQLTAVQKANDGDGYEDPLVTQVSGNEGVSNALANGTAKVAAGTSWLWAREDMADSVDVLFVDEAGQMSLANVLAISQAARSVLLLGDPQQLDQPQRGVHPPGVDVSALAHLLDGHATIAPGRGLFLNETWRLHPDVCRFTSELFYDGRLAARPENQKQRLNAPGYLDGTGLRFLGIEHVGNQSESTEEVEGIQDLIERLLRGRTTWTNKKGKTLPLGLADILVVAPYNAQVSALTQRLPVGARVGTVDKFQGQEAPIVFYSMATSTPEEAPRGMDFLYSLNRLNVAISRAQCVAVIVASPALFQVQCKTPRHIRLANAFCRYLEMATAI
jgi:predicted RecB family nuclease